MKFVSLISGSSGNAALVSYKNTNILVDCGASGKAISSALLKAGASLSRIDALVLTHEHSDHVKGAGVLARRCKIPIYATAGTHASMTKAGSIDPELKNTVRGYESFCIKDIEIMPFPIYHDASEPVGYRFGAGGEYCAVATDTGHMDENQLDILGKCRSVILESNHDIEMLRCGPYPFYLQQRILSDYGHLSNTAAADAALELVKRGTEHIALGHLSEKNNLPEIALLETHQKLTGAGVNIGRDVTLCVAKRYDITEII